MAVVFCFNITAFADSTGDPNVDNGGGGLLEGTEENLWHSGNDGVRVTIVDAKSGEPKSVSLDYSNKDQSEIAAHFGQVSKMQYLNGAALTPTTSVYRYTVPAQPLPTIISNGSWLTADINEIRSYFTDEQVVKSIAGDMGFTLDTLTNGDYKMTIEPIMYITYDGVEWAMTATEAALYNQQTGGDIINKFGPLSHKNLPFALFLEEDDLGYTAWTGATDTKVPDSEIISNLGIGVISFKEEDTPLEIGASDYDYRVDTDVYTSVIVSGGGEHTPDNPVTVVFTIKNRRYTVNNVVYPEDGSQLVWVKWHTPKTEQTVNIKVTVKGGGSADKTTITANVTDLDKNPPPNPTAYDRNDSFRRTSPAMKPQKTSLSWSVWEAEWEEDWVWDSDWDWIDDDDGGYWEDNGEWVDEGEWVFDSTTYRCSLSATMEITPDSNSPTATATTLKSGYGINEAVSASASGNGEHTDVQNAVTFFPEFNYKSYWRLLDSTSKNKFKFKENKYSTYNNRTHFTPVWYPDGSYKVYTWVMDCWCPAGMLSVNKTDTLTIRGNVYDDWHIAPTY